MVAQVDGLVVLVLLGERLGQWCAFLGELLVAGVVALGVSVVELLDPPDLLLPLPSLQHLLLLLLPYLLLLFPLPHLPDLLLPLFLLNPLFGQKVPDFHLLFGVVFLEQDFFLGLELVQL